jgi:predicted nucleotidyltransferase
MLSKEQCREAKKAGFRNVHAVSNLPQIVTAQPKLAEFCKKHGIRRFAFFGSVLTAEFSGESDIDCLVTFARKRVPGLMGMARMEEELREVLGVERVDIRTPADLSPHFRDDVLKEAEVIYGK